jgi:flagellar FliJ protein
MKEFSLAGLLRVRGLQEQLAAADLAQANRALNNVRARRAHMRAELEGTTIDASGSANLAALAATRAAGRTMLAELASLDSTAAAEVGAAAAVYRSARAASLGVEKLHVRHVAAETAEDLRTEQAAIDEVATGSWARQARVVDR